jgi:hypothetical protein
MTKQHDVCLENSFDVGRDSGIEEILLTQLNEYETAPYFIQFSQNLTCDCFLISVFSPEFT